jgi:hypothetical protein
MADISTAAVSSSLRVGLHVVSNYKRPVLEIYHQVCNKFGPEHEFDVPAGADGQKTSRYRTRFQDIFIQFTLVNIGGVRAEDVELAIVGSLKRNHRNHDFGGSFKKPIPQFAPGQSHFLFRFDDHDLLQYPEGSGSPIGLKDDSFTITISYNAPSGVLNWFLALPSRLCRRKRRFTTTYTFSPQLVAGDLPPPEYAG